MNFLRNLMYFAVAAVILILGALFAVQNTATAPLDLLVVVLPERSVALWVLLAFAAGGIIGMLTNIGLVVRLRAALARTHRRLAKSERTAVPGEAADAAPTAPRTDRDTV